MAWHQTGDKSLPEPMRTQFTDAYMGHERDELMDYCDLLTHILQRCFIGIRTKQKCDRPSPSEVTVKNVGKLVQYSTTMTKRKWYCAWYCNMSAYISVVSNPFVCNILAFKLNGILMCLYVSLSRATYYDYHFSVIIINIIIFIIVIAILIVDAIVIVVVVSLSMIIAIINVIVIFIFSFIIIIINIIIMIIIMIIIIIIIIIFIIIIIIIITLLSYLSLLHLYHHYYSQYHYYHYHHHHHHCYYHYYHYYHHHYCHHYYHHCYHQSAVYMLMG